MRPTFGSAMRPHPLTALLLVAALAGFAFAAVSTYDFVAHLDRQVHGIHCSFLPGIGQAEAAGTGCHVTLMSPYSSVFRSSVWGGIPISLPAMSVFCFLAFWALWLVLRDKQRDPVATGFALAATVLPLIASAVMAYISLSQLGAACKLCIGIYVSSAVCFLSALLLWNRARNTRPLSATYGDTNEGIAPTSAPLSMGVLGFAFGLGVLFVVVPVTTYALSAPDFDRYVGSCGQLSHAPDPQLLVALGPQDRPNAMIEVLDPLCPSCRGFETRFADMPVHEEISRKALLFPLDNTCNWMVSDAIHPGACAISEAMLCAGDNAEQVMEWAFSEQENITAATKADPKAAARLAVARFPELARCIGMPAVRAKLNLVLRFAVKNRLQVLTPQVFVGGLRLCDEDTDLGLDYALPRLVERARTNPPTLTPMEPARIPPPPPSAPRVRAAPPAATAAPKAEPAPAAQAPAEPAAEPTAAPAAEPEPPDESPLAEPPPAPEPSAPAPAAAPPEQEAVP
jgi:uncharacterized membrane protein